MKAGDRVKSKRSSVERRGTILDNEGTYSSWGEYHVRVGWDDGRVENYPVKMLEIISDCR